MLRLDIVIDDGSHKYRDQQLNLAQLLPLVRPGGYYVIEDVHTSLQRGYDAPPASDGTTLNVLQRFGRTRRMDGSPHLAPRQKRCALMTWPLPTVRAPRIRNPLIPLHALVCVFVWRARATGTWNNGLISCDQ